MKNTTERRVVNLRRIIDKDFRGSQTLFSERVGISLAQIGQWLASPDSPHLRNMSERSARKIEEKLGLTEGTLDISDNALISSMLSNAENDLFIPIRNVSASMGPGYVTSEFELVIDSMQVSRSWLRKELPQVTSLQNLQIITSVGDSMSPTFDAGDLLLIDTGVTTISSDLIYAFTYKGCMYAKRIFVDPVESMIYVKSDNPSASNWKAISMDDIADFTVHGRVIYAWKGHKL